MRSSTSASLEAGPSVATIFVLRVISARAAALEFADADLGALQVGHDRDVTPDLRGSLAHELRAHQVILGRAMGEIEAHDVDAGRQHAFEHQCIARCGAQRGDDLRAAGHQCPPGRPKGTDRPLRRQRT